ncbi:MULTISPECIES: Dyp-type peroxidase [unclassified Mycobacterium]|uniref:Dyp-type peroxidase n=1 Tax=unclassified Mycobacterium TaxID=2642494 RepID=UPI00074013F2|nr:MULTISPECIES: Dyp-type peroxidase [unclassified Mycobacterium]KUH79906.1 peroxidase [Mycobacterium sp. GA-0227b]KUH80708.1 peroxidase [Mycobacterium sp. IS-1556]KUH85925.1 peroxidase [Mycobacterium sp. GA-1999]
MAERSTGASLRLNRRRLLAGSAAAVAAGATLTQCSIAQSAVPAEPFDRAVEPFHGKHQAGVATPPQTHALFVALDLTPQSRRSPRETLAAVLKLWTSDAARLTQGTPALADTEPELAYRPARLTVTVGLGPGLFDRIGLAHRRPRSLAEPPAFTTDRLQPQWCGGDLLLQICANDPVTVAHTGRVLLKNVRTMTTQRWRQTGFRNAIGNGEGASMRNLMGQIDGTANITDEAGFDRHVWDAGDDQRWFDGGTILVLRRIRAEMDTWDELDRSSKELTVGRRIDTGAPLTGQREFDEPDFSATENGIPVIPPNSHIALARHRNENEQFLRRPYNFDDPPPAGRTTESGLIFAAYQRDPAAQFMPVQQRLAASDALNEWITTIGSATFAILPGVEPGGYLGQTLLA